jgi:hypothetical protein
VGTISLVVLEFDGTSPFRILMLRQEKWQRVVKLEPSSVPVVKV